MNIQSKHDNGMCWLPIWEMIDDYGMIDVLIDFNQHDWLFSILQFRFLAYGLLHDFKM